MRTKYYLGFNEIDSYTAIDKFRELDKKQDLYVCELLGFTTEEQIEKIYKCSLSSSVKELADIKYPHLGLMKKMKYESPECSRTYEKYYEAKHMVHGIYWIHLFERTKKDGDDWDRNVLETRFMKESDFLLLMEEMQFVKVS